jgi:hypothetical protein
MLDRARFLVVSEIAEVTREAANNIEQKVDTALDSCIATKARVGPKAASAPTQVAPVLPVDPVAAMRPRAAAKAAKAGIDVATKRVAPRSPVA